MTDERPTYTPATSIFAGGATGMLLGTASGLVFVAGAIISTPAQDNSPFEVTSRIVQAIPGIILIASIFAFPAAALMVYAMIQLAKRFSVFDNGAIWVVAGLTASSPIAWFFERLDSNVMKISWLTAWVLLIGAFSATAAWRWRRPLPLNIDG